MKTTKKKFWKFKNEAEDERAELMLYGAISNESWFGDEITPKAFAEDLAELGGKAINVHINSPGGDVFAAQSIYNQLKAYANNVTVYIDGIAASAATIIACAGDSVVMPDNALFMIHNPSTVVMGDADAMKQAVKTLDKVKETIVNVYLEKVSDKLTDSKISRMMDNETWMTAQEAFDNGFIDVVDKLTPVSNQLAGDMLIMNSVSCDLSKFHNADKVRKMFDKTEKGAQSMENNELLERIKAMIGLNTPKDAAETENDIALGERERIKALDALNADNSASVAEMVNIAKENGMTAAQVKPFVAVLAKAEEKAAVADSIRKIIQDNLNSGADGVKPAPQPANSKDAEKQNAIDEIVNLANRKRG